MRLFLRLFLIFVRYERAFSWIERIQSVGNACENARHERGDRVTGTRQKPHDQRIEQMTSSIADMRYSAPDAIYA
jgi:hypothetical protein